MHKGKINQASRSEIAGAFSQVAADLNTSGSWLQGNPYFPEPEKTLRRKFASIDTNVASRRDWSKWPITISDADLIKYIAASSFVHFLDAASYLSAALKSLLAADLQACRHLSYYSELRSALSILACRGIGIFDKTLAIATINRDEAIIGSSSTHAAAWHYLSEWSTDTNSLNIIEDQISLGGSPLRAWLHHFGAGASPRLIAKQWIAEWGLDLSRLSHDRETRNQISYNPSFSSCHVEMEGEDYTLLIDEIWALANPQVKVFAELDKYLIRKAILKNYFSQPGGHTGVEFRAAVQSALTALSAPGHYLDFLSNPFLHQEPKILSQAAGRSTHGAPKQYLEVLSRSVLLLRLSYAAIENMMSMARTPSGSLRNWAFLVGERRGLWDAGSLPAEISDLWNDVEVSRDALKASGIASSSAHNIIQLHSYDLIRLSAAEQIPLWTIS